jgi:UDP:flavonoid glycosyltransferase YjiC (YdhE family)
MANILYGVNGGGAGHSSRSREILTHLQERGHAIHVVSFDRGLKNLAADFDVTEIFGMRPATAHNRVRHWDSGRSGHVILITLRCDRVHRTFFTDP